MLKNFFVNQGIREVEIQKFIRTKFPMGDYSKMELQRTPLGIKIVIYTNKPGRIIGRGGKNINEMTDALKENFSLENPQIDIKSIRNPNLDAKIVAKQISSACWRRTICIVRFSPKIFVRDCGRGRCWFSPTRRAYILAQCNRRILSTSS